MIALIAAVAENGVIGNAGDLPWHIKSEWQYFVRQTKGKPVIMGRKTFESLDAPLKDRANIVITRDKNYSPAGVSIVHSLKEALDSACGAEEIMVIGGAEIYAQALPLAQRLYLTEVHLQPKGDTRFPAFDRGEWVETKREFHAAQSGETCDYTITVLERRRG